MRRGAIGAATALLVAMPAAGEAQRETRPQMRRIVAQALCLAVAYPESAMAADSRRVLALYAPLLGDAMSREKLDAVTALAREAKPSEPAPVGGANLAIARCTLFADRADVNRLLGLRR